MSWANLKRQLEDEYANDHDGLAHFKKEFLGVLKMVKQLYPAARVQECLEPGKGGKSCGLTLLSSPPPITKLIR